MSNFDSSKWSDSSFAQEYRDQADSYVPERHKLIEITQSLYKHFVNFDRPRRVLDLGCGDGLMVQELLKVDGDLDATLVDGSQEMLNAVIQRLARFEKKHLVNASFQDLLAFDPLQSTFCFVLSSLATHHLVTAEKEALFAYIYRHLEPWGFFLNIDVVLSPTDHLESWYMTLWREWIDAHVADSQKTYLLSVPQKYKDNPDNVPDPLLPQLQTLTSIGFDNVDCYYKYGVFTLFGGSKGQSKYRAAEK
jgi:tRNA (cmo5U34)-methyltransferase